MALETLQIETPRLVLRVPRAEDLDAYAAMMVDEESARFIGGVAPREVTWRMSDDDDRRLARVRVCHVLGHREGHGPVGGTPWAVDARRVAGTRGRLGQSFASVGGKAMPPRVPRPPPTGPSTTSAGPR